MSTPTPTIDPMKDMMDAAATAGTNIIKVTETAIVSMVPIIGYTITAVTVVWGGKSIIMNVIEVIDRGVDIKKN